jgi:hypothetical protein
MSPSLSPRFCGETIRRPESFDESCDAHDYANAIASFGEHQRDRFRAMTHRREIDESKKSIVSIFQPKSGGTFLHNRMLGAGYQEFWWLFSESADATRCFASIDALELFVRGGCTCHTHARPDPNILAALDQAGVENIWVHLRNPAASAVSCYYHYLGEGHGSGEIGERRRQEALDEAQRRGLTPGMDISKFVHGAIDFFVKWVAEWIRFADRHPGLVVFSYYQELANPEALLERIFSHFGATLDAPVSTQPAATDRYRRKRTADWRSELEPAVQTYVERRVLAEFEGCPQFDELWY